MIEIKDEFAGLVETVGGKSGVEEAAGAVSGRGAGGIAENKEKLGNGGIFEDGLQSKFFSQQSKFCCSRYGLFVLGAHESGERDGFGRRVGGSIWR